MKETPPSGSVSEFIGPTFHELKIWSRWFEAVKAGKKRWEIRENDRGFMPGNVLVLKEWDNQTGEYTGNVCLVRVEGVWEDLPGLEPNHCLLDVVPMRVELA